MMKIVAMMKNHLSFIGFTLLVLTAGLILSIPSPHEATADSNDDIEERVSGTYRALEDETNQLLLTFVEDGSFLALNSGATAGGYTTQRGSWKATGKNEITGRTIAYIYDVDNTNDIPNGTVLNVVSQVYVLKLADETDGKFQTLSGTIEGTVFPPDGNPLTDTADPAFTAKVSGGMRVTVP